jgi:hypothetical protein
MAAPVHRWVFDNLLWDTHGRAREGFEKGLWATRKLVIAILGSALLTWQEWVAHHPPEIVIVALIHFVFVLAAIALVVFIGQRFSKRSSRRQTGSLNGK